MTPQSKKNRLAVIKKQHAKRLEQTEPDATLKAKAMSNDDLVTRVRSGFQKIADELPYILELRERFFNLPRGKANIGGCSTWAQFCTEHLNRSPSRIRHIIREATKLLDPEPPSKVEADSPTKMVKVEVTNETRNIRPVVYVHEPEPNPQGVYVHVETPESSEQIAGVNIELDCIPISTEREPGDEPEEITVSANVHTCPQCGCRFSDPG